jgi:hypothetical protein
LANIFGYSLQNHVCQ